MARPWKINFLLAGDFPGDGKPKPVTFPDPREAAVELDPYVRAKFDEVWLASRHPDDDY